MELADMPGLEPGAVKRVWVRLPYPVPCGRGEIGKRGELKPHWQMPWWFESTRLHIEAIE